MIEHCHIVVDPKLSGLSPNDLDNKELVLQSPLYRWLEANIGKRILNDKWLNIGGHGWEIYVELGYLWSHPSEVKLVVAINDYPPPEKLTEFYLRFV